MELTKEQKDCFSDLWFIYGNDGVKCTMLNHKLIQGFFEYDEDRRESYRQAAQNVKDRWGEDSRHMDELVTKECLLACNLVLKNRFVEAIELAKK